MQCRPPTQPFQHATSSSMRPIGSLHAHVLPTPAPTRGSRHVRPWLISPAQQRHPLCWSALPHHLSHHPHLAQSTPLPPSCCHHRDQVPRWAVAPLAAGWRCSGRGVALGVVVAAQGAAGGAGWGYWPCAPRPALRGWSTGEQQQQAVVTHMHNAPTVQRQQQGNKGGRARRGGKGRFATIASARQLNCSAAHSYGAILSESAQSGNGSIASEVHGQSYGHVVKCT